MPQDVDIIFDVGATHIRAGTHAEAPSFTIATPSCRKEIIAVICSLVGEISARSQSSVRSIKIACPGLVDENGFVHKALYIDLSQCNLKGEIEAHVRPPVTVANDAKVQALGFLPLYRSLFLIALGTGVGGAIIDRGRLVMGHAGFAGEIGHVRLGRSRETCSCGRVGCLDLSVSGKSLERRLGALWWTARLDEFPRHVCYAMQAVYAGERPEWYSVSAIQTQLSSQATLWTARHFAPDSRQRVACR